MRGRWIAAIVLVVGGASSMMAQSVWEPPAYPEGHFCSAKGTVNNNGRVIGADHPCACHRTTTPTVDDPVCDGTPVQEDQKCLQFCHFDHCRCVVHCEVSSHAAVRP